MLESIGRFLKGVIRPSSKAVEGAAPAAKKPAGKVATEPNGGVSASTRDTFVRGGPRGDLVKTLPIPLPEPGQPGPRKGDLASATPMPLPGPGLASATPIPIPGPGLASATPIPLPFPRPHEGEASATPIPLPLPRPEIREAGPHPLPDPGPAGKGRK